jgi:hypothetical protein
MNRVKEEVLEEKNENRVAEKAHKPCKGFMGQLFEHQRKYACAQKGKKQFAESQTTAFSICNDH